MKEVQKKVEVDLIRKEIEPAAEAVPKRIAIQTKLPPKVYPKHEEFASKKPAAVEDDKIFQAMAATGLNP